MAINPIDEILHHVYVRLYPNYFVNIEGAYIARTNSEASLSIEKICAALKNRGGFTGNYDDLVEYVKQFFDEMAYQLCDGFAVNTGYFSIHPHVSGTFDKITEGHDTEKHPVTFRFRIGAPLHALADHIVVEVEGIANVLGYIDEFVDVNTESVNGIASPNGLFSIAGHKIKIIGENAEVGIYFVSEADPAVRIKVSGNLAENTASKLIGVIPSLSAGKWKVEIRTQFNGSVKHLKEPRVIEGEMVLTVPQAV